MHCTNIPHSQTKYVSFFNSFEHMPSFCKLFFSPPSFSMIQFVLLFIFCAHSFTHSFILLFVCLIGFHFRMLLYGCVIIACNFLCSKSDTQCQTNKIYDFYSNRFHGNHQIVLRWHSRFTQNSLNSLLKIPQNYLIIKWSYFNSIQARSSGHL